MKRLFSYLKLWADVPGYTRQIWAVVRELQESPKTPTDNGTPKNPGGGGDSPPLVSSKFEKLFRIGFQKLAYQGAESEFFKHESKTRPPILATLYSKLCLAYRGPSSAIQMLGLHVSEGGELDGDGWLLLCSLLRKEGNSSDFIRFCNQALHGNSLSPSQRILLMAIGSFNEGPLPSARAALEEELQKLTNLRLAFPNIDAAVLADCYPQPCLSISAGESRISTPIVSFVVPTYNAGKSLARCLSSVQSQSLKNFEVIIVNDCSTDDSLSIAKSWADADSRFVIYETPINGGAYAARVIGVAKARGSLIHVLDADDWLDTHFSDLAVQGHHALGQPAAFYLGSSVRVDSAGVPAGTPWAFGVPRFTSRVPGSLVFSRDWLQSNTWIDSIRIGADAILQEWLKHDFGSVPDWESSIPLKFMLLQDNSLTMNDATSLARTGHHPHGSRNIVDWTARAILLPAESRLERREAFDEFVRPRVAKAEAGLKHLQLDFLIGVPLHLEGGTMTVSQREIRTLVESGYKVGILNLPQPIPTGDKISASWIEFLFDQRDVQLIDLQNDVEARVFVGRHPYSFKNLMDVCANVKVGKATLVLNQAPIPDYRIRKIEAYNLLEVGANFRSWAKECGATKVTFVANSKRLAEHIVGRHERFVEIFGLEDWVWGEPVRFDEIRDSPKVVNPNNIVIGKHARDSVEKWPATAHEIRQAFPEARGVGVRILGGAEVPKSALGSLPRNWRVEPFSASKEQVSEFLDSLDFFILHQNRNYLEAHSVSPLEAMSRGVPILAGIEFEQTYGQGAIYCEPVDTLSLILELASDKRAYLRQRELGFETLRTQFAPGRTVTNYAGLLDPIN